jgi:LuxR family maltose regulon positive regulatory protein
MVKPAGNTQNFLFWVENPRITNCRILIAENTPDSRKEAAIQLQCHLETAQNLHHNLLTTEVCILLAMLENNNGNINKSTAYLKEALKQAENSEAANLFLEVADNIEKPLRKICRNKSASVFSRQLLTDIESLREVEKASQSKAGSDTASQPLHVSDMLTNREMDVIVLLEQRLTNQEIADRLSISVATVKRHTITIYHKLGAKNRRDAVIKAADAGIISL